MRRLKDDITYNRFNPYKALYYSEHLKQISKGEIPYPVIWHIYPTNKCCNNCNFCIMKSERDNPVSLSRQLLLKAVKEAKQTGSEMIHFSGGGEPLMNLYTIEAIIKAKEAGLKVSLSTNGFLLTREIADSVDFLRISLNAANKQDHEKIMGVKTFDKIIANIKRIKNKNKVGLAMVITKDNCRTIYGFCNLANKLKVGFVHIRPVYSKTDDVRDYLLKVIKQADKAKKDFPKLNIYCVSDKFDGYWTERKYRKCLATPMNAVLKANAKFIICQDMLDKEFGDYNKQSFREIWGSDEHRKVMEVNLKKCPRCVMTKINEFIQNIYIDNKTINELL